MAQELYARTSVVPTAPVTPEQGCRTEDEWMQEHAHLARLRSSAAIPLTLVAQETGTTTANAGCVDHAQASIGFLAPFVNHKGLIGRTAQRAIGLEGEVLPRETARFESGGNRGLAIAKGAGLLLFGLGHSGSKLGGAYWIRMKQMPQFQAYVPDPLTDDLPYLLSGRRMATPAIRVDLLVFIGKQRFKSATMQVECYDIGGGESILREKSEKEFVDHALAGVTDAALFPESRVGSHHDATAAARLAHRDIEAVVERAHQGAFRATEVGIRGQVQPRPHDRVIQHRVVFAPHHKKEAIQICNDGPRAVEAV